MLNCFITFQKLHTVELRSKGPGWKGNPPIREKISRPIKHFHIYIYIGYKGISVYGKNKAGPLKSLGAKFHCTFETSLVFLFVNFTLLIFLRRGEV